MLELSGSFPNHFGRILRLCQSQKVSEQGQKRPVKAVGVVLLESNDVRDFRYTVRWCARERQRGTR